ncbi:MAG: hypothetical protein M3394_07625 [Actinomycetota bacterium]|nr:hypothetical protein [Actinomycetota bacterium]
MAGRTFDFTTSPAYEHDRTVYAAGESNDCEDGQLLCGVLYRSADGGRSWSRLPARGRLPGRVLLPPSYPSDNRIFSVSPVSLMVSTDDGATFRTVAPAQGDAAMSPAFSEGDPRILFSSDPLRAIPVATEYNDATGLVTPLALPLPTDVAAATFAFSPAYSSDGRVLVWGVRQQSVATMTLSGTFNPRMGIFSCDAKSCEQVLDFEGFDFRQRLAWVDEVVYASTQRSLYRSMDNGRTFAKVVVPGDAFGFLEHFTLGHDGTLYAGVLKPGTGWQLFASPDRGDTWELVTEDHDTWAVRDVAALPDGTLLVGSWNESVGIRCSADGGRSWAPLCPR